MGSAQTQDRRPVALRRVRQTVPLLAIAPVLRWLVVRFTAPAQGWRVSCAGCDSPVCPGGGAAAVLYPPGRCGRCRTRAGAPPWLLEVVTVAAAVIAVAAAPGWAMLLAVVWWLGCAVPLLFVDLREHRLPNPLTYAALAGVLLFETLDALVSGRWDALLRAASCAAVYGLVSLVVALVLGRRGLGLGDVKLILSISALLGWWGWNAVFGGLFLGFLIAGLTGVVLLVTRRVRRGAHIAMGPAFVAGTAVMLALLAWSGPG
jgi:leader peptidase (prepilin peptidase)/N-methyltransferase